METIDPGLSLYKPSDLPANVDVKFEIRMSDTYAADGTMLEWLSLSEESSASSESDSEVEMESIQVSDNDIRPSNKVNNLTKLFEQQKTLHKQPVRVTEKVNGNVKGLAGYFDQPRKGSMPSSASEMDSGFGQSTRSSTSFEGSIHDFDSLPRGRSPALSHRERSKSRMERGAERARAKLEKMAASLNQPQAAKKRSKSVDPLNNKLPVSKTTKSTYSRAKSEIRKDSLAVSSVPKRNTQKLLDEFERTKVNVDKNKKEISMTLSPQLELDNIANLAQVSKAVTPEKKKVNRVDIISRKPLDRETLIKYVRVLIRALNSELCSPLSGGIYSWLKPLAAAHMNIVQLLNALVTKGQISQVKQGQAR